MSVPVSANCSSVNVSQSLYSMPFVSATTDASIVLPITFTEDAFVRVSLRLHLEEGETGVPIYVQATTTYTGNVFINPSFGFERYSSSHGVLEVKAGDTLTALVESNGTRTVPFNYGIVVEQL